MEYRPASAPTISRDDRNQPASLAIVTAVAEAEDVSPVALRPLAEVVDPDALDEFVDGMDAGPFEPGGVVKFSYSGYDVSVTDEGAVSISRRKLGT